MGVYIDRDELLELYANTDELDISNYDVKVAVIRQNILDMPTIDIVRCKECEYFDYDEVSDYGRCSKKDVYEWHYKPTDFCSSGKRRADQSQINTIENTNDKQSKEEAFKEIVKDYITATYGSIDNL